MASTEVTHTAETFVCNSCNVKFSGRVPFAHHLEATPHVKIDSRTFECSTCGVPMNSKQSFEIHINGSKHKRKLDRAAADLVASVPTTPSAESSLFATTTTGDSTVQHSGGAWRCTLCDLSCSSSEQFNMHLSGKKHARRSKLQTNSVARTLAPDASDTESNSTTVKRMSRKRALFSYTKAQLDGGLDALRQLECSTTSDMLTPMLSQLPLCMRKSADNSIGLEVEPKRQHTEEISQPNERVFCTHAKCMLARALKCYESTLRQLQTPPLDNKT
ncbi:unnamed protein product [Dicrocoelium dendriticum]|nr:unnamed protein product [Dicrocoelium dendriticum]